MSSKITRTATGSALVGLTAGVGVEGYYIHPPEAPASRDSSTATGVSFSRE